VNGDHNVKSHLHIEDIPQTADLGVSVHPPLDYGVNLRAWLRVARHDVIVARTNLLVLLVQTGKCVFSALVVAGPPVEVAPGIRIAIPKPKRAL